MGLGSRAVSPEGVLGGHEPPSAAFELTPTLGGKCQAAGIQSHLAVREDASDFALARGRGEMLQKSRFAGAVGPDDEDLLAGFEFGHCMRFVRTLNETRHPAESRGTVQGEA